MDLESATDSGLSLRPLSIGLREVLAGWSGEGDLFSLLHALQPAAGALDWKDSDIRRRAQRVLLGIAELESRDWPTSARKWSEWLPLQSDSVRVARARVAGRVDWSRTVRSFGWPSREYIVRERSRSLDEVSVRTLSWLSNQLQENIKAVGDLAPELTTELIRRVGPIGEALVEYTDSVGPRPDRLDLMSLATAGYPWQSVSHVAELVVRASSDPEFIAYELIAPTPADTWRLFHLATFGMTLRALHAHRFVAEWHKPVGGSASGAHVTSMGPSGRQFDLWFEGGAARQHYQLAPSPYGESVAGIAGAGGRIGTDVLLVEPHHRALLLECKWSTDPRYVGRYGYHQAASYALEARAGLAESVWSFVVGPQEVVPETSYSTALEASLGVVLGSTSPSRISDVVAAFLANDSRALEPSGI